MARYRWRAVDGELSRIPFVCGAVMSLVSPAAVQQMKITGKPFAFDPTN